LRTRRVARQPRACGAVLYVPPYAPLIALTSKLAFIARARLAGTRVSLQSDIKGAGNIRLGRGAKVHARATLDASHDGLIRIGEKATINRYAFIQGSRGGVEIGDRSEINNYSVVNGAGGVRIGRDVLIGPGVKIISYNHRFDALDRPIREQPYDYRPIVIGDDVWIGAGAVILAGVEIGSGAVVAAGAVVTHSLPPRAVAAGVPARVLRARE
jgi:acetyltransferase-like isoleucine patch superfamily enzyme